MCKRTKPIKKVVFVDATDLTNGKSCLTAGGVFELAGTEHIYSEQVSALLAGGGGVCNHQLTAGDAPANVIHGPETVVCGDTLHFWGETVQFSVSGTTINGEVALSGDAGNRLALGTDGRLYASETLTTLTVNGSNLEYVDEAGTTNVIPIASSDTYITSATLSPAGLLTLVDNSISTPDVTVDISALSGVSSDANNSLILGSDGLAYFDETLTAVTPLVSGHAIASYTDEDGGSATIEETITSLVDNANGTFSYTSEDGTITVVDVREGVSSDALNDISIGSDGKPFLNVSASETVTMLIDNGDGTFAYTNEGGAVTTIDVRDGISADAGNLLALGTDLRPFISAATIAANETTSLMTNNGDGTYTYTDEDGTVTVIDVKEGVSSDANNSLTIGSDGKPYFDETLTAITPLVAGHIIASYTDEDGGATNIEETVTSIVDNGNGTSTFTDESGATTIITTVPNANRAWGTSDTQRTNADSVVTSDNIFHTGQVTIGTNNSGHNTGATVTVLGTLSVGLANHTLSGSANLVNGSSNTVNASQAVVTGLSNNAAGGRFLVAGTTNIITGTFDAVVAGAQNTVTSSTRSIIAGEQNSVTSMARGLVVGDQNVINGGTRSLIAGITNTVGSASQQIVAGNTNTINGAGNGLLVGNLNTVDPTNGGFGTNSIVGGLSNTLGTNRSLMIGQGNTALGNTGVNSITFGLNNDAAAVSSLVGGYSNSLDATSQNVVLSGSNNTVTSSLHSLIVGEQNIVSGQDVLVSGQFANQAHNYGVMFGGDGTVLLPSSANAEMTARMSGGFRFFTNNTLTAGVTLAPAASAWVAVSDSATKTGFHNVNLDVIATKFRDLGVRSYLIKGDPTKTRHIGVMADKFNELFGDVITPKKVGDYNGLSHQDVDGVLMAMVHYLLGRVDALESKLRTA